MNYIEYQYDKPPSLKSKLIQSVIGFLGMRKSLEKKMITNNFKKEPTDPPKSMRKNFKIEEIEQNSRKIWIISPKNCTSDNVVLFLHGGAYMANLTKPHWSLIEHLCIKTNSIIVVPDYPLTPEATYKETYNFLEALYARLIIDYPTKPIIFIGDSAGGGLALGFAQQLRNVNKKQAIEIILLSPWLDISMTNPNIKLLEKKDNLLSIEGLKSAGQKYAGALDLKDFRLSPIYGDFTEMPRISIFTSTNDILNADARKCYQQMRDQQINSNFFEYPAMFHDWIIITDLKESQDAISKITSLINGDK